MVRETSSEDSSAMVTVSAKGRNSSPARSPDEGDGQEDGHSGQGGSGDGPGHFPDGGQDGRELVLRRSSGAA